MSFNNGELNRVRRNWDPDHEKSEKTDPDYTANAEQRFLQDLAGLSETALQAALSFYPTRQRKKLDDKIRKIRDGVSSD